MSFPWPLEAVAQTRETYKHPASRVMPNKLQGSGVKIQWTAIAALSLLFREIKSTFVLSTRHHGSSC